MTIGAGRRSPKPTCSSTTRQAEDPHLALMLSRMFWPDFPVPVGVLRVDRPADPRPADRGPDRDGGRRVRRRRSRRASSTAGRPGRSTKGRTCGTRRRRWRDDGAPALPGLRVREPDRATRSATTAARTWRGVGVPQATTSFHGRLLGEHLDELGAPAPLTVDPRHPSTAPIEPDACRPASTACSSSTTAGSSASSRTATPS